MPVKKNEPSGNGKYHQYEGEIRHLSLQIIIYNNDVNKDYRLTAKAFSLKKHENRSANYRFFGDSEPGNRKSLLLPVYFRSASGSLPVQFQSNSGPIPVMIGSPEIPKKRIKDTILFVTNVTKCILSRSSFGDEVTSRIRHQVTFHL